MPKLKRITLIIIMLLAALTVIALTGMWSLHHAAAIQLVADYCNSYFVSFMVCRLMLMIVLLYFWPSLVSLLGKCWHWTNEAIAFLISQRFLIVGCLLSIELLNTITKINW